MTTILALDLGTATGFALAGPGVFVSGEWKLKERRNQSSEYRYINLRNNLDTLFAAQPFDQIWYEAVHGHKGVDAAHWWGGFRATVQMWCADRGIPFNSAGVGQIKKHATGKGNASKDEMIAAARAYGYNVPDNGDNEADAISLARLALDQMLFGTAQ